jgi:dynein heavy chain 2
VREASLVIKSLRINTLSKLTFDDAKRFNEIVRDMFPAMGAPCLGE